MHYKNISNAHLRTIFILLGIGLSVYLIYLVSNIIIYIICAFLLSFIAEPIINFLTKKFRFNSTLAIVSTLLLIISILFGIILMFIPLFIQQSKKLSLINVENLENSYLHYFNQIKNWLEENKIDYHQYINPKDFAEYINFNFISDLFNSIISSIGNLGFALFTIFFICFFILKDQNLIRKNFMYVLPPKQKWRIFASVLKIKNMLAKYAIALFLQCSIVFILYFIVLKILGVDNAFIIAFLGGLLNIIPYVGPIIALILTIFLVGINYINQDFNNVIIPTTLNIIIGYIIVQALDNNISQPLIFSKSTNSHPLEIFIVILISGTLFGITGMLISIPCYTALKIILKEFYPNNRFINILTRSL